MISDSIVLRPEIRQVLETSALEEARGISDLVNEALEDYFLAREVEKLNQEIVAYEGKHKELWQTMPNEWVAFHNQQLIDHDPDDVALHRRIRAQYGRVSVLIRQVKESAVEEIWMRTSGIGRLHS